jgi:hypothetical protein
MRLVFCGAVSIDEHATGCLKFCLIDHDRRGWRGYMFRASGGGGRHLVAFAFVALK